MSKQICMSEERFDQMEKSILEDVTSISKSILETFKFRMLYGMKVSSKLNSETVNALKNFRSKNWDTDLSRSEAYNKYIGLY